MKEEKTVIPTDSSWPPIPLEDMLDRVDDIHRAITRAIGRIEYLKMSAYKANSTLTPVKYGRGVERSRIEYAVLECDAERWGIGELKKERILDGVPCGIIGRRMHFSRSHVYRLVGQASQRMIEMYNRDMQKKENHAPLLSGDSAR